MSYTSENVLPRDTSLRRVIELIGLLGFEVARDNLRIPNRIRSYFWYDQSEYRSWTGVELDIYRRNELIIIHTRSTISRSYWDLHHQNRTIRLIKNNLGGHFTTDAGKNRCWVSAEPPPSPLSSGCYLARWRFHNALMKARIYISSRRMEGRIARETPSGVSYMDQMNPRLLSNNLLIPYAIAVWEDYFRSTFAAAVKYAKNRDAVLKRARLSHTQLEQIATKQRPFEQTLSECFSFQRPSMICDNFRMLDNNLNLASSFRKPYRHRKISLYDSLEAVVESRNSFVHTGEMDLSLFDKKLNTTLTDIVEAVDRSYSAMGSHFGFLPIRNF